MNRIFKTAVLSAAVAATMLVALPAANADDWHRWHHHGHGHGDAVAAGVLGLAAGALIGGALANQQPPPPDYYDDGYYYDRDVSVRPAPVRRYYAEPRVVYADRYAEPWTRDWYEYCSDRYRTFNSRTGTFTGNDGEQHFCTAN
ncbi:MULTISPECIES: BA14K family protein [unclassified Mesorhizobium]|uniref:BA14K family protein n=1 Tax=unclassified Mesorhizobium TaxID=325217 RepID=UPI001128E643|nr:MULTISPECIES: BA14K family protein [unclassified Mesorhizobium]TPL09446.1 BA14K family protein [Mesorhizobium sp. B2-4-14]UCI29604.1 BA14K family protein [Mesorhizobium sp. B4-1-4]